MARNEEKAHAMLNKWMTLKQTYVEKGSEQKAKLRRPFLTTDCKDLSEAEQWRREIVRDTVKKVSEIQNSSLGEHVIRDLNDNINKLLRQRYAWERRIVELGGPNYTRSIKQFDAEGRELPGGGGYKYFGAAKELPGVRELFQEKEYEKKKRRTRADLYKFITPDYFGWRDDEDERILSDEIEAEQRCTIEAEKEWHANKRRQMEKGTWKDSFEVDGDDVDPCEVVDKLALEEGGGAVAVRQGIQSQVLAMKKEKLKEILLDGM